MSLAQAIAADRRKKARRCLDSGRLHPRGSVWRIVYRQEARYWLSAARAALAGDTSPVLMPSPSVIAVRFPKGA